MIYHLISQAEIASLPKDKESEARILSLNSKLEEFKLKIDEANETIDNLRYEVITKQQAVEAAKSESERLGVELEDAKVQLEDLEKFKVGSERMGVMSRLNWRK